MFYNTDKEWESFGKQDPYFGVLSYDKFHVNNLTVENKDEFFHSGEEYVEEVKSIINRKFGGTVNLGRILDFGCGVGRISIPLASHGDAVVGADISQSMLIEAQKNSNLYSIENISFVQSDDCLSTIEGAFDFIHSSITFQHISVGRGEKIFAQLIDKLNDGGICSCHFIYERDVSRMKKLITKIKGWTPFSKMIINLVQKRSLDSPVMQMNCYDIGRLLEIIQSKNGNEVFLEFTKHAEYAGVVIWFQKTKKLLT